MVIPVDMSLQLLMVADYLDGAYPPACEVDDQEYCLLIWPSTVWETEISAGEVLESIHPDPVTVLVSLGDLWAGTAVNDISSAKGKEIKYSVWGVYIRMRIILMLRIEFSPGATVQRGCG